MIHKTKINYFLIPLIITFFIFVIFIFFLKIECNKSIVLISDNQSTIISVNKKTHKFLNKQKSNKVYYIKDIATNKELKSFLVFKESTNNVYQYYCNIQDSLIPQSGIYQTNLNFGNVYIYEYLVYFN